MSTTPDLSTPPDGSTTTGVFAAAAGYTAELEPRPESTTDAVGGGWGGLRPYYNAGGITIFCGDNRRILPLLDDADLLCTDPPYGIGEGYKPNGKKKPDGRWAGRKQREYYGETWDDEPAPEWMMQLCRAKTRNQIVWGGNYYPLPPSSCWLVWDKLNGDNSYADCELAWTNLEKAVRRIVHQWHGMIRKGNEERYHPTQKPLDVMAWCLRQVPDAKTVLDPWMGSGTTLVAAKLLGLRAVGIEANEAHCKTAVDRLAQDVLPLSSTGGGLAGGQPEAREHSGAQRYNGKHSNTPEPRA